jgi:hypothetical protein
MIVHCPDQIRMFGNLDVMDANRYIVYKMLLKMILLFMISFLLNDRWEETHLHFAKKIYERTPKRMDTLDYDLFIAFVYREKVNYVCEKVLWKSSLKCTMF